MTYYEIYNYNNSYEVWEWTGNGQHGQRFKVFKTKKGAENWAKKQWCRVIWK